MKYLRHILETNSAKIVLAAVIILLGSYGLTHAGSLTPIATPAATMYTLGDIYTRLTTNATSTSGNHSLSTTTAPASSFHTLTEIYNAIPTIDPTKVLTGTSYLGVAGSASSGGLLKTGQTGCWTNGGTSTSCTGTGQDAVYQKGVSHSYTDNGDGTITDNVSALMWKKCSEGLSGSNCATGTATETNWQA